MSDFSLFLIAALALNITPGPDILYITARSLGQGRKAGVVSALGIGVGSLVHTIAATLGLSALVMSSAIAYGVLKWVGAVYLIYLGVQAFLHRESVSAPRNLAADRLLKVFAQGALTNILNPKVALFYVAFLPQFVDPSAGSIALQFLLLGLTFSLTGIIWNSGVGLLVGSFKAWIGSRPFLSRLQRYLTGSILIGLGIRVALPEKA